MQYMSDKQGSKLLFLTIIILFVYLAGFNFDLNAAYQYTMNHLTGLFD